VDRHKKWEKEEQERIAQERHMALGLGKSQSRPMSSQSIMHSSQVPHSSSETKCLFCGEFVMWKNFSAHLATVHPFTPVSEAEEVIEDGLTEVAVPEGITKYPPLFNDYVELVDAWMGMLIDPPSAVLANWEQIKSFLVAPDLPTSCIDSMDQFITASNALPTLLIAAWERISAHLQNHHFVLVAVENDISAS
jgi:hypothetical protein